VEQGVVKIVVSSFGYKYGTPTDADLLLDARTLLNPFSDKTLRDLSGLTDPVWTWVTSDRRWRDWKNKSTYAARLEVDKAINSARSEVIIGIGCTGGRHRSVVATLEVARFLYWRYASKGGCEVKVGHRDLVTEGKLQKPLRNLKLLKLTPEKKIAGT